MSHLDLPATPGGFASNERARDLASLATWPRRGRLSVWRTVSAVCILAIIAFLGYSVVNADFNWSVVARYLTQQQIMLGLSRTLLMTVLAMVLAMLLGTLGGVCRLSANRVVSGTAWLYVWFFRGTPALVQLLLWFNVALIFPTISIPGVFHDRTVNIISPLIAAVLGLGINEGAYLSEIVRGGILAVDPGQREAAMAIGSSSAHMYRRVILPQTLRIILPTLGNETIGMLKFTSLASVVSYSELLESAEEIYQVTTRVMELLIVVSVWYLILTSILSVGQYYLERRYGRSEQRGRPRALAEQWIMRGIRGVVRSRVNGKAAR